MNLSGFHLLHGSQNWVLESGLLSITSHMQILQARLLLNYAPILSASPSAQYYYYCLVYFCFVYFCVPCVSFWACHRKHRTSDLREAGNLEGWVTGMMEGLAIVVERLWVGSSPV